jgi:PAS domain S-box-containing protein
MPERSGSNKKYRHSRVSVDASEKDRLITELNHKIQLLEKELRPKQEDKIPQEIIERKIAEAELCESEEILWVLVETTRAGIVLIRGDKYIYVNPMIEKALGYSKGELLSMNYWDIVHPDSQGLVRSRGHMRQQGLPVASSYEIKVRTKDGDSLWAEFSAAMIDYQGQPTIIATIFDITERKRAEDELKAAKAQAELYLDLMGHDINNMHQIALGYLEMARDLYQGAGTGEFLDKPIEVLQRSTRLIRNVRKLQKLHDGMFRNEPVDVAKVIMDVQGEFRAMPDKVVMLNLNDYEHCHVRANELLHDVFANLVSNAIKHTGDRADIMIDLNVVGDNGGKYCRISVEDNGPGVPDEFKGKIFNRILKGTDKAKGMGLGLYLVKSLVGSYDGRVWVEDRIAGDHTKGARFVVMLPAMDN